MYKATYPPADFENKELELHQANMAKCVAKLEARFPGEFQYKTFIMNLDGSLVSLTN
jgi:hypothetical protein